MAIEGKYVARIFGSIFHTVLRVGEGDSERVSISKSTLFNYSSRIFDLKPAALTEAILILKKVGQAVDVGDRVVFKNPNRLEEFFEYYQYYWYQPELRDYLLPNGKVFSVLGLILESKHDEIVIPVEEFSDSLSKKLDMELDKGLFDSLVKRGVTINKADVDGVMAVVFQREEIEKLFWIQNMLSAIDERIDKAG